MIETRIVEYNEAGKEFTIILPEPHDLNGPGDENLLTNFARYLIDENLQPHFKNILHSDLGLMMLNQAPVKNSLSVLEAMSHSRTTDFFMTYVKPVIYNMSLLANLALMFYPNKKMYWKVTKL